MKLSILRFSNIAALLPAILFFCTPAYAEAEPAGSPHDSRAFIQDSRIAGKGAAALPRLEAHTYYAPQNGALTPIDSSVMSYATPQSQSPESQTVYQFANGKWNLYSRYNYTYDTRGNNVVSEYKLWNSSSAAYINLVRYNYSYNSADARTALFYEIWDVKTANYGNGLREVYTLNGRNNVIDYRQELWIASKSVWQNSEHYTYTYTAQESMEESFYQYWDANATPVAVWRNKTRHFYMYDASGKNRVADTTYQWGGNSWEYYKLSSNMLNPAGLPATVTDRSYNSTQKNWAPIAEHTYTYNQARGVLTALHTQWDATSAGYINNLSSTQAYNSNGQPTVLNTESWTGSAWAVGIGSERGRNYYEGEQQLGVFSATNELAFTISPLPASDVLHISLTSGKSNAIPTSVLLMNVQGQVLENRLLNADTNIPVAALPAGTYILTVKNLTGATTSRVVPVVH